MIGKENNQDTNQYLNSESEWKDAHVGAIVGTIIGLLAIGATLWLFNWNENRLDISKLAATSINIDASAPLQSQDNNKLATVSGIITTDENLSDNLYVKPGKYIFVRRDAQMYAWDETEKDDYNCIADKSEYCRGGHKYTYSKAWTSHPHNSDYFAAKSRFYNPEIKITWQLFKSANIKIGNYSLANSSWQDSGGSNESLNTDIVNASSTQTQKTTDGCLYFSFGSGNENQPQIGDQRVCYYILKSGSPVLVMGKISNDVISPFSAADSQKLFHIFTLTKDEAIKSLHLQHEMIKWALRFVLWILLFFALIGAASLATYFALPKFEDYKKLFEENVSILSTKNGGLKLLGRIGKMSCGSCSVISFIIIYALIIEYLAILVFETYGMTIVGEGIIILGIIITIPITFFYYSRAYRKQLNKLENAKKSTQT
ncbi:MAG: TMEM43 family protein [Candidatus Buchananbacteria bacterium]